MYVCTSVVRITDSKRLSCRLISALLALFHHLVALLICTGQDQNVLHSKCKTTQLQEGSEESTEGTQKQVSYSTTVELGC